MTPRSIIFNSLLLLAVGLLGFVLSTMNTVTYVDESRRHSSRSSLRSLCVRLVELQRDCRWEAPASEITLTDLVTGDRRCAKGPRARPSEINDGWNVPIRQTQDGRRTILISNGSDRLPETEDDLHQDCARAYAEHERKGPKVK